MKYLTHVQICIHKMLMNQIKENLNKWRDIICLQIRRHSKNDSSLEVDAGLMQSYQHLCKIFCRYSQDSKIYVERQWN